LHIEASGRRSRRALICLAPPGNVAREIALYRRALFAELGEGSAFAFPEVAVLASCLYSRSPRPPRAAERFARLWRGLEEPFATAELLSVGERTYLGLRGPIAELSRRASDALGELGLEPDPHPILEPGLGFFLFRRGGQGAAAPSLAPPTAGFLDCSIALLAYAPSEDPFAALRWRFLAEAKRRTGPAAGRDA
jgi:hypothetical protein